MIAYSYGYCWFGTKRFRWLFAPNPFRAKRIDGNNRGNATDMKIAVHQMCSGIELSENTQKIVDGISSAGQQRACMYFAPEMSVLIDRDRQRAKSSITSEANTPALSAICRAAADAAIWVNLGSMPVVHEDGGGRYGNRSIVIDDQGIVRARYDKMHLFDVDLSTGERWRESAVYNGGDGPVAVETPLGLMGLTICYDIRFPDLYSQLARAGVQVFSVPAAFTVPTGVAHWHVLLRARAIESAAFVVAAAQSGKHADGRETFGHSLVVDPWGDVILDMGDGEGLSVVDLDMARIEAVRAQIPVHLNRRAIPTV